MGAAAGAAEILALRVGPLAAAALLVGMATLWPLLGVPGLEADGREDGEVLLPRALLWSAGKWLLCTGAGAACSSGGGSEGKPSDAAVTVCIEAKAAEKSNWQVEGE